MGPSSILNIIGVVVFRTPLLTILLIAAYTYATIKGFEIPIVAITFYFSTSIVNPHSHASFFSAVPMAKVAFGVAFLSMLINSHKIKIYFPPQFVFLLAFLLISNISSFGAVFPDAAAKRHGEFNKIGLICFITVWAVKTRKDYNWLFYGTIFSFFLNIMKSLTETQTKGKWYAIAGPGGWLKDSNDYALGIAMVISLFYVAAICSKNKKMIAFYALSVLSALMTITLTSSRGGFLGAAAVCIILLVTEPKKMRAFLFSLIILMILIFYMPESYVSQLNTIFDAKNDAESAWESEQDVHGKEYTGAERVYNWKLAYLMAQDYPLTGVGWGNYVLLRGNYEPNPGDTVCHSTWFQIMAEIGFLGLGIYILMILAAQFSFFRIWRQAVRDGDSWLAIHARGYMAGLAAFCISGSFVSREYSDLFFLFLCMAVILPNLSKKVANI